ncbi:MAG: serine hydrolase [Galactobacter sp.]
MSTPVSYAAAEAGLTDLEERYGLRFSAKVVDVFGGTVELQHAPETVLNTASVGKVFLLHRLLAEVDTGTRSLEERVTRRPSELIDNSGLWYLLQQDTLSLYDVAALVGAYSDNTATNTLARVVGLDAVAEHTRALGYTASGLDDCVRWPIPPGAPSRLSHGSAEELADFCARLARREGLSSASVDVLTRWLGAGADLSMVASAFGLDPLAHAEFDRGLWVWNKTGTLTSVRADIGVVMNHDRALAYAVLAQWPSVLNGDGPDARPEVRDDVLASMCHVGEAMRADLATGA